MKKSFIISIVAIIIILAAGAGFWKWKSVKKAEIEEQKEQVNQWRANVDTNNWKTYRDEKLGFEFKYPGNWSVENDGLIVLVYFKGWRDDMPEGGGALYIEKTNYGLQNFVKKYEESDYPHSKITDYKKYEINGILADKLVAKTAIGIDKNILFIQNKSNYIINFYDFDKYHQEIISTLKFIN